MDFSPNMPPLASIDETEDDLTFTASSRNSPCGDYGGHLGSGYISSSSNNKIILTNNSTTSNTILSSPKASSDHHPHHHHGILSPASPDEFGGMTTMTMASSSLMMLTQDDELGDTGFFSSSMSCSSKRSSIDESSSLQLRGHFFEDNNHEAEGHDVDDDDQHIIDELLSMDSLNAKASTTATPGEEKLSSLSLSTNLSNSLGNLVNSFDEKVKNCLHNFEENVSSLAPVQVRSSEEVIKGRPAWWTLTGNYGNILPIDWAKLSPENNNVPENGSSRLNGFGSGAGNLCLEEIDEAAEDIKLRHLIDSCLEAANSCNTPTKSVDDVLEEIDAIMSGAMAPLYLNSGDQLSQSSDQSLLLDLPDMMMNVPVVRRVSFYRFSLEKLKSLSLDQLQDLNEDLECKVQKHSEGLIKELARRDELEFEKEVKNRFISLMLSLQNRRKEHFQQEQQQNRNNANSGTRKVRRYLTTVIPYNRNEAADNVPVLQVLIKILKAMLEDSPTVPTLLTDYILKHICPTTSNEPSSSAESFRHHFYHSNLFTPNSASSSSSGFHKSMIRSIGLNGSNGSSSAAALSHLTSSINNKLKAARRSFSFSRNSVNSCNNNNNNNDDDYEHDNLLITENNNNLMSTTSKQQRKSSISSAASFDNAILV